MHSVRCPHCETRLNNVSLQAGQVISCPRCRHQFQLPHVPAASSINESFENLDDPQDGHFGEITESDQRTSSHQGRRQKANPSLAWIVIPGLLSGLVGGVAAGLYFWGSEMSATDIGLTIGAVVVTAIPGSVLGLILWGLAKQHRGLAYGAVIILVAAWGFFVFIYNGRSNRETAAFDLVIKKARIYDETKEQYLADYEKTFKGKVGKVNEIPTEAIRRLRSKAQVLNQTLDEVRLANDSCRKISPGKVDPDMIRHLNEEKVATISYIAEMDAYLKDREPK